MRIFGGPRPSKPDPVGDICRLLVERPWEWVVSTQPDRSKNQMGRPVLTHVSGVYRIYENDRTRSTPSVWLALGGTTAMPTDFPDAERLYRAILGNAAARVARPKASLPLAVRAMMAALKADDLVGGRALADLVMESQGATPGGNGG